MPIEQGRSRRKQSGGRFRPHAKRKKRNLAGEFSATRLGELDTGAKDTRGTDAKIKLNAVGTVNVATDDGEVASADIDAVLDNDANPDFVRRDIITKGAVLDTSEGTVRVTSRPGQDGTLNAVAVDE